MEDVNVLLEKVSVDRIGVVSLADHRESDVFRVATELLPEARSVVVMAMELFSELVQYLTSEKKVGELLLRDLFNRNADIANGHLDWESYKLVKDLHQLGYKGIPLTAGDAPFDSRFIGGMLNYKEAARLSGMGVTGWHSMLLTPEFGARQRLTCVVTDAPFTTTTGHIAYYPCEQCGGACVKICPVHAIKPPAADEVCHIDRYLCNTYLTGTGGCSECLRVCPADRLFRNNVK